MKGAIVREVQRALLEKGFDPGPLDGAYGKLTRAAVLEFQSTRGIVVDGEVGKQTARALYVLKNIKMPARICHGLSDSSKLMWPGEPAAHHRFQEDGRGPASAGFCYGQTEREPCFLSASRCS